VKSRDYTLPKVLSKQETFRKICVERPIPGGALAKRRVSRTLGSEFHLRGLIEATESRSVAEQIAELKALADGVARSLDFEDGSDPVTCLMLDPTFNEDGKPNQALYEALFVQSA